MGRLLEGLMGRLAAQVPVGGGGADGGFGPNGKLFRDIGKFSGEEGAWAEWALKFRATVKEYDANLFKALELAGDSEVEVDIQAVEQSKVLDKAVEKSAMLYNRFVHLLNAPRVGSAPGRH